MNDFGSFDPAWQEVDCTLENCRAIFRRDNIEVVVDATHHDFFVTVTDGDPPPQSPKVRPLRLAATRRGLGEVIQLVDTHIGPGVLNPDAIEGYVMDALIVAGRAVNPLVDDAFTAVDLVVRTPLVCCRGVVHNPHLLRDLIAFRPAAVALARIEDEDLRDASVPERTEIWADVLSRWRDLYCAPQSTRRSVNRTLSRLGEEASAEALWGLRRVLIDAPLPSIQHLEVLGSLGARHNVNEGPTLDPALHLAVLRASTEELGTALVLIDEGQLDRVVFGRDPPAMRLAEILTVISVHDMRIALDRRVRFDDILQNAIHALQDVLKLNVQTIEPPIPLPRDSRVTFLATIGDILKEGVEMDHCVATRAPKALSGASYIFHVEYAGETATVEVSADGRVLEARGPENVPNGAVAFATSFLSLWALPLRLAEFGPEEASLWSLPAPSLPAGFEPVRTIAELNEIVAQLLGPPFDGGDKGVLAWVIQSAELSAAGNYWIGVQRVADVAFELCGRSSDSPTIITTAKIRTFVGFDDEETPDLDDDWDLRT